MFPPAGTPPPVHEEFDQEIKTLMNWSSTISNRRSEQALVPLPDTVYTAIMSSDLEQLACVIPDQVHPLCQRSLENFAAGELTVHSPAYTCNMVDSSLIPLVECLLDAYAEGVLLLPIGF